MSVSKLIVPKSGFSLSPNTTFTKGSISLTSSSNVGQYHSLISVTGKRYVHDLSVLNDAQGNYSSMYFQVLIDGTMIYNDTLSGNSITSLKGLPWLRSTDNGASVIASYLTLLNFIVESSIVVRMYHNGGSNGQNASAAASLIHTPL